jgi:cell division transport system permease protein
MEQRKLEALLLTVEGVESVRAVSKAEAFERFRAGVGSGAALLEGLEENPLPASLEIQLLPERRSPEGMRIVAEAIDGLPGIAELASGQDWVGGYLRAIAVVRGVGIGMGILLALATLLIVTNTIRLAVYARRDELSILWLVGGSRSFMNTPFLIEGIAQGVLGGVLAVGLLYATFRTLLPGLEFGLELVLGGAPRFFTPTEALALVALGAGLGLIGSIAAVTGSARP